MVEYIDVELREYDSRSAFPVQYDLIAQSLSSSSNLASRWAKAHRRKYIVSITFVVEFSL